MSSPTALNDSNSTKRASPTLGTRRAGRGYNKSNNYDPDEPLDVLREMNQMPRRGGEKPVVEYRREEHEKSAFVRSRGLQHVRRLGVETGTRLDGERKSNKTLTPAEELRRQLDQDSEFSMDMLAAGDRATILAREAEILERKRRVFSHLKRRHEERRGEGKTNSFLNEKVARAEWESGWHVLRGE